MNKLHHLLNIKIKNKNTLKDSYKLKNNKI